MKVLITGGAGFIGSHIVEALIDSQYQVGVVDNLVTGHLENLPPQVRFYKQDVQRNMDEQLAIIIRKRIQPVLRAAREGDTRSSVLQNDRAQLMLRWSPGYSLQEGLLETVHFFQQESLVGSRG
jgi:UDP-glucose 4-epimerase